MTFKESVVGFTGIVAGFISLGILLASLLALPFVLWINYTYGVSDISTSAMTSQIMMFSTYLVFRQLSRDMR